MTSACIPFNWLAINAIDINRLSAMALKRENKLSKKFFVTLVSWICLMSILSTVSNVCADQITSTQALRIVSQYQGVFTSVPTQNNTQETTDAPLLGNGDLGVSIQNNINGMVFILGKNEFWSLNDGMVKAMARLSLSIPGMSGSSYSMKENIATAEATGSFGLNGNTITTKSWVQADNTVNNMLITQFAYTGSGTQNVSVSLAAGNQNAYVFSGAPCLWLCGPMFVYSNS
jgi:alpha-L-fucosidase 2